jgi:hypothetical protein
LLLAAYFHIIPILIHRGRFHYTDTHLPHQKSPEWPILPPNPPQSPYSVPFPMTNGILICRSAPNLLPRIRRINHQPTIYIYTYYHTHTDPAQ